VFHAFSRIVNEARRGIVVLDTAPTGHTLLLLDATGAYHREVLRTSSMPAERVVTPMMRLRDPDHTRILIVTLPETTPVLEAEALQSDLRRADIEPWAWIVNQSLAAADTTDPLLRARRGRSPAHRAGADSAREAQRDRVTAGRGACRTRTSARTHLERTRTRSSEP
jgi:arsenite/tail-anchored protein-transporting ATPase